MPLYKYRPKTKEELVEAIKKEIYEVQGTFSKPNWKADLNCIDTSLITDMSYLFAPDEPEIELNGYDLDKFNGDISNWNVSNVENMESMFDNSKFNGDISKWNVSNVKNMSGMFGFNQFNKDISKWDVSNVTDMSWMFADSPFNRDISKWNVSNVRNMTGMFQGSKFNQDISNWNISNVKDMEDMFLGSDFNQDIGSWPLKEETGLENISVSLKYNKLPEKIIFSETVDNILHNKDILYKLETVTKLFIYSLEKKDKNFNFKLFFKDYLNNRKEIYKNKGYKPDIANKLVLNDVVNVLKSIKDKDIQKKFMKITMNKDSKEPEIEVS